MTRLTIRYGLLKSIIFLWILVTVNLCSCKITNWCSDDGGTPLPKEAPRKAHKDHRSAQQSLSFYKTEFINAGKNYISSKDTGAYVKVYVINRSKTKFNNIILVNTTTETDKSQSLKFKDTVNVLFNKDTAEVRVDVSIGPKVKANSVSMCFELTTFHGADRYALLDKQDTIEIKVRIAADSNFVNPLVISDKFARVASTETSIPTQQKVQLKHRNNAEFAEGNYIVRPIIYADSSNTKSVSPVLKLEYDKKKCSIEYEEIIENVAAGETREIEIKVKPLSNYFSSTIPYILTGVGAIWKKEK